MAALRRKRLKDFLPASESASCKLMTGGVIRCFYNTGKSGVSAQLVNGVE